LKELRTIVLFHFGPKQNPFWAKTERILRQNGVRFAAKWRAFCGKMEGVLRQNGKTTVNKCYQKQW